MSAGATGLPKVRLAHKRDRRESRAGRSARFRRPDPARLGTLRWYPGEYCVCGDFVGCRACFLPRRLFDGNYVWRLNPEATGGPSSNSMGHWLAPTVSQGSTPILRRRMAIASGFAAQNSQLGTKFTRARGAVAATIATGHSPSYVVLTGVYVWVSTPAHNADQRSKPPTILANPVFTPCSGTKREAFVHLSLWQLQHR